MSGHQPASDTSDRRHAILAFIDQYYERNGSAPSDREILEGLNITGTADVHFHIEHMEKDGWITSVRNSNGRRRPGTIRLTELGRRQLPEYSQSILPEIGEPTVEPVDPNNPTNGGDNHDGETGSRKPKPRIIEASYVLLSARISNRKAVRTVNIPVLSVISASFGTEVHSSDFSISALGPDNYLNINQDMLPARLKTEDLFALEVHGESMIEAGIQDGDYVIVKRTQVADNGDMCVVWIDDSEVTLKYFYREEKRIRLEPANSGMAPRLIGSTHKVMIQGKVVLVVRL